MYQISKIALIGGTGKSGKYVVKQLLDTGFHFKLLLRNPENFSLEHPRIEILKGDARDPESVLLLLKDCQAVVSTLGQPRNEPTIFSQATTNVLNAMSQLKIHRYILTTGLNVDTPEDKKGAMTTAATEWMKANYPETTFDKQAEYELLAKSRVDWTLVRLPLIEPTDERRPMSVSLQDCPGTSISAADIANFLIGQLSDHTYVRSAPFIANTSG